MLPPLEEISFYRRVEEAFHCKLKGQIVVDKKTLMELQNFQMVRPSEEASLGAWGTSSNATARGFDGDADSDSP